MINLIKTVVVITAVSSLFFFAIFWFVIGALIFITWSTPVAAIPFWLVVRACVSFGLFVGIVGSLSYHVSK